jgi:hypothetical protein
MCNLFLQNKLIFWNKTFKLCPVCNLNAREVSKLWRNKDIGPTNQEAGASPSPGFPHTMLSVERVKDNMRLAFTEKLFINHAIRTNVQTKYLRFKGMSYENKSYLCDVSYVQLQKALARFRCGNTQLEVC